MSESPRPTTDQHMRALVLELRRNTAAMSDLAKAIHGLVSVAMADQHGPPDAEAELPVGPKYLCDEDR